jgi:hypothetical protein
MAVKGMVNGCKQRRENVSKSAPRSRRPGHIERLFREVAARESDDITAILDKFGCLIVGPALLEGVYSINSPRDMT